MNLQNWQLERQLTVLGVSGGIDSMVLLHVFLQNNWPCVVAHVNYQLRDEDSRGDMEFVVDTCNKLGVECHVKEVNTKQIASELGISIQMAARDIRYHFFEEVLVKVGAQKIATAHHQDDELENFFIYLMRNQIHSAWMGIPEERGNIIRPLLRIPRKIIADFAAENAIKWREDCSNLETKYLRNKIRHFIVPQIKEQYPTVAQDFQELTRKARENERENARQFELRWKEIVDFKQNGGEIPQEFIVDLSNKYGIFKKLIHLGFDESQIVQAVSVNQRIGSIWLTRNWKMTKLRSGLLLGLRLDSEDFPGEMSIDDEGMYTFGDLDIEVRIVDHKLVDFKSTNCYYFHVDVLKGLTMRPWKQGDKMTVFGLNGHKKVSDIFVDHKIDMDQKRKLPLLIHANEIVAILSVRRSNLFLFNDPKQVVRISWYLK